MLISNEIRHPDFLREMPPSDEYPDDFPNTVIAGVRKYISFMSDPVNPVEIHSLLQGLSSYFKK